MRFLTVLFSLSLTVQLFAATPSEVVETIFNIAAKAELVTDAKLQSELESYVDFDQMANVTLGTYLNTLSKNDVAWYRTTIKTIITKTVYPKAGDFLNKVKIDYQKPVITRNKATINSVVKKRAQESDVTYMLENKNGWKITDIALDDESWTLGIKRDVVAVIKKDGFAGLKIKLNKRLDDLKEVKK